MWYNGICTISEFRSLIYTIDESIIINIGLIYTTLKYEIGDFQKENTEITTAILDLAINNELYTRLFLYKIACIKRYFNNLLTLQIYFYVQKNKKNLERLDRKTS